MISKYSKIQNPNTIVVLLLCVSWIGAGIYLQNDIQFQNRNLPIGAMGAAVPSPWDQLSSIAPSTYVFLGILMAGLAVLKESFVRDMKTRVVINLVSATLLITLIVVYWVGLYLVKLKSQSL